MIRKYWYLSGLAFGAAVLPGYGNLQAQLPTYGFSISSLPAQVGKPFTVTIPVPAAVPDGTTYSYSATPSTYGGIFLEAYGVSVNHQLTIQAPPFTTPGRYSVTVGQTQGNTNVGVSTPLVFAAVTINLIVSPVGQNSNPLATFAGDYAFLFKGQTIAAPGAVSGVGAAGAFTADGNGNITSGTLDVNTAVGINLQNAAVTGTYQLDATGKGSLQLVTPQGPLGFNFFVPPNVPGFIVRNATLVPAGGFTGTGEISQAGNFFNQGVVFYGSDPYSNIPLDTSAGFSEESTSGGGFLPGAGLLAFNIDLIAVGIGQAIPGSSDIFTGVTGTYSSYTTERFTMTLSAPGQSSTMPTHYAVYQGSVGAFGVNGASSVLYFLSLDPHSAANLVTGKLQK